MDDGRGGVGGGPPWGGDELPVDEPLVQAAPGPFVAVHALGGVSWVGW